MAYSQGSGHSFVKAEPTEGFLPTSSSSQGGKKDWDELLKHATEEDPSSEAAWDALLDCAEESGDNEKVKAAYDALLQKYPNISSIQISYLNHFLVNQATFPYAEMLFARFLRTSVSVDLWKFYIVYVRRLNSGPDTRDTVTKAYEFALQHVGQDKDSAELWSEYIQFVKSGQTSSTWEEQQKMDALRKIYQRAVQIPLENVEILWKDYEAFENLLNKITAKKFLQDLTPAFIQARSKLRDLRKYLGPLLSSSTPQLGGKRAPLDLPKKPTYSTSDRALVGAWKQYLKWEEGNPLEIEDKAAFSVRIQGVYRKAIVRMRFFSEIWFMAYAWTSSVGRAEEALQILKSGLEANSSSFLLNFAYAEAQELAKNYAEVHATFGALLQVMQKDLEELDAKLTASDSGATQETNMNVDLSVEGQLPVDLSQSLSKEASIATIDSKSSSSSSEGSPLAKQFKERKQENGLVWVMYIRFALRAEGLPASRAVFSKARKDKFLPWEVFEAAALMEYHVAKETAVANRILSVAMNKFASEIDFVVRYLTFLMSVNDENNARALFERTVGTFPPEKARPLWERWARYEYQYGTLESALRLEKRMADVYPSDPPIKRFAQRHIYANIDGIANRDLGVAQARQVASLGRVDTVPAITVGAPPHSSASFSQPYVNGNSFKLPDSPDMKHKESERDQSRDRPASITGPGGGRREEFGAGKQGGKRGRDDSPVKDRGRWGGGGPNKRFQSPGYQENERNERWRRERDHERTRSPPRKFGAGSGAVAGQGYREEPPKVVLPEPINFFVSKLPSQETFDGPVFRTDDLMQLFRNAIIPGSTPRERSPPVHAGAGRSTRPPPDYGPYRGPDGRGPPRY